MKIQSDNIMKKPQNNTIIFTGGGTGGHIYPNLALIPIFENRGYNAVYIGGEGDTMERRLATQHGIPYFGVPNIKLVRSLSPSAIKNNLQIPAKLSKSIKTAQITLRSISPKAVFSKGGFAALPVTIAAQKLNIPVFCHESDYTIGLANRIAAKGGATVFMANPQSGFDGIFTGMPLRQKLFNVDPLKARTKLSIPHGKHMLLIVGGSSGAGAINDAVAKLFAPLTTNFYVVHITGKGKHEGLPGAHTNYIRFDYADNIEDFYAAADVILSRAGATAVYELSSLKKRAVFVPLPKTASRGDQLYNARLAQSFGAQILMQDKHFLDNFLSSIHQALHNPPMRAIAYDANRKIADIVCARLGRGEKCTHKKLSQNGWQ